MNDLTLPGSFADAFPTVVDSLRKAAGIFERIRSFEDLEREILQGSGLSPNTYRTYLAAVRDFYQWSGGLHPFQVRPNHVEAWYDALLKRGLDRNTARLRIAGLKKFFGRIREVPGLSFYVSPFEILDEKLKRKLSRTKKGGKLPGLSRTEVKRLLEWLLLDETVIGRENYAAVYLAVVTGLRASELLALRWKDVETDEESGKRYLVGVGKGDKPFRQEVGDPRALDACRLYFRSQFRRDPRGDDWLFWTVPSFGEVPGRMSYAALWRRIVDIGTAAREAEVLRREVRVTPHTLRRTAGKILDAAGASLVAIQGFLRHSNIQTTTRYVDNSEAMGAYFAKAFA